jgi:cation diffusion facilitator family transporter
MGSAEPRDAQVGGERVRAGWLSLIVGSAVFAGKLAAFGVTGSSAVLSDAMESVVNVAAAALLVYSLIVASRPADHDHPYGHGKVEFFSAGVEGALIAVAAVLIVVQAVGEILRGPDLKHIDLGVGILLVLTLANGALGAYLVRLGRRTRSIALEADGKHLFTDVWTSVGVVAGLVAVRITGWAMLDPLVALGVAAHILTAGWSLMRRAVGGLMDEADSESLRRVVEGLESSRQAWCIDVHGLRAWRSGALQHVDLHMAVPRFYDVDRVHEIGDSIEATVLASMEAGGDVLIHFDPCRSRQCSGCAMSDCGLRESPFSARVPLTLKRAVRRDEELDSGAPLPAPDPTP